MKRYTVADATRRDGADDRSGRHRASRRERHHQERQPRHPRRRHATDRQRPPPRREQLASLEVQPDGGRHRRHQQVDDEPVRGEQLFHDRRRRSDAVEHAAHHRQADVPEEEAGELIERTLSHVGAGCGLPSHQREDHQHRRHEHDARRLRRRRHRSSRLAHLLPHRDSAREVVHRQAAPQPGVRRVQPDEYRDRVEHDQRDDTEEEHGPDGHALLFAACADDGRDGVHGGRAADHRPPREQIPQRTADTERRRHRMRHEERARHAGRRDEAQHQQLRGAEDLRLELEPHEDDPQTQEPLARVTQAGCVAIRLAVLPGLGETDQAPEHRDVGHHPAQHEREQYVGEQRGRRQHADEADGGCTDREGERDPGEIGARGEPLRSRRTGHGGGGAEPSSAAATAIPDY